MGYNGSNAKHCMKIIGQAAGNKDGKSNDRLFAFSGVFLQKRIHVRLWKTFIGFETF
jgi:hypothetical protein